MALGGGLKKVSEKSGERRKGEVMLQKGITHKGLGGKKLGASTNVEPMVTASKPVETVGEWEQEWE